MIVSTTDSTRAELQLPLVCKREIPLSALQVRLSLGVYQLSIEIVYFILIVPASAVTVSTSTQGTASAGSLYSIVCAVARPVSLLAMPVITWVNPSGIAITTGQTNSTRFGSRTVDSMTIQLDPLLASHSGMYACEVSFLPSSLLASLNLSSATTITVQSELRTLYT